MHIAEFGRVLIAMAQYSRERADQRRGYLGKENCELLLALSHTLAIGGKACIDIAEENKE